MRYINPFNLTFSSISLTNNIVCYGLFFNFLILSWFLDGQVQVGYDLMGQLSANITPLIGKAKGFVILAP